MRISIPAQDSGSQHEDMKLDPDLEEELFGSSAPEEEKADAIANQKVPAEAPGRATEYHTTGTEVNVARSAADVLEENTTSEYIQVPVARKKRDTRSADEKRLTGDFDVPSDAQPIAFPPDTEPASSIQITQLDSTSNGSRLKDQHLAAQLDGATNEDKGKLDVQGSHDALLQNNMSVEDPAEAAVVDVVNEAVSENRLVPQRGRKGKKGKAKGKKRGKGGRPQKISTAQGAGEEVRLSAVVEFGGIMQHSGSHAQDATEPPAPPTSQAGAMPPPAAPASRLKCLQPSSRAKAFGQQQKDPAIGCRLIAAAVIMFRMGRANQARIIGQYTIDLIGKDTWEEILPEYMNAPPEPDDGDAVMPLLKGVSGLVGLTDPLNAGFLEGVTAMMN